MKLPRPLDLFAAEVQYWRLEPQYWEPILVAAKDAGLPGISSYVKLLAAYVRKGGILVVSNDWPRVSLSGEPLDFLGLGGLPSEPRKLGKGKVVWSAGAAASEPGKEDLDAVARMQPVLSLFVGVPAGRALSAEPVTTMHSSEGRRTAGEPECHNLVEAILHQAPGARVLYLLNLHDRAVKAAVRFCRIRSGWLSEVGGTGARFPIVEGMTEVDLDRKAARVFRVLR